MVLGFNIKPEILELIINLMNLAMVDSGRN